MEIVLPFGLLRQRKPRGYDRQQKKTQGIAQQQMMKRIAGSKMGQFYYQPEAEIKPWKPRLKTVVSTTDQTRHKPSLLILRHDPSEKKVMYLEQDLMAHPISDEIDKQTGFSYRIIDDKSVIVRKYLVPVEEDKLVALVHAFVKECNRVLFMHCDTD